MYLLDTNICIYIIKAKLPCVLDQLKKKYRKGVAISAVTLAELEHGVCNSSRPEQNSIALSGFLSIMEVLPFDAKAAQAYGKIRTNLQRAGRIIGPLDMLIAAHAISNGLTLVTNNTKEFARIKDIKIENWARP